jgi:8-oxo-dGTP diphosphatase
MKTGACAVMLRGSEILLGKRSATRKFYPDVWDLLGGHCEPGEQLEQTLVRELREELDIVPSRFRKIDVLTEPNTAANGEYRYHVFLVDTWIGTPHNCQPQEHAEIRWFPIEAALGLKLAHPNYPHLFKAVTTYASSP